MAASELVGNRIVHYRYGEPFSVLKKEHVRSFSDLSHGQVCVRINKSIVHPGDLQLIEARYGDPSIALPDGRVPGLEAAGVIQDASSETLKETGLEIGSRVMFFSPGAWQNYAVVQSNALVAIPDDISDVVATQLLINTITARQVLRHALAGLDTPPKYILQTGASSAVAKIISMLAIKEGIQPIRLVRSDTSAYQLHEYLPGGHIISTEDECWKEKVLSLTNHRIQVAIDSVGGKLLEDVAEVVERRGKIVFFGNLSNASTNLNLFIPKALSLSGVTLGTWQNDTSEEERMKDREVAIELARTHPALFAHSKEFSINELEAAIHAVTARGKTGNVILTF